MKEGLRTPRLLSTLAMLAIAAFLALSVQLTGPVGTVSAQLPPDGDADCTVSIEKSNDAGGEVTEDEGFTWELEIDWDDDCDDDEIDVTDNIPSGFDVNGLDDGGFDCDDPDEGDIDCTDAVTGAGATTIGIDVEVNGDDCGDIDNTASVESPDDEDEDTNTVEVDCEDNDEDIDCDELDELSDDELDELGFDDDEIEELDEDCEDDEDDEDENVRIVPNFPVISAPQVIPRPTVVAAAPAPAPVVAAPAPAVQLPRAGEGPLQGNGTNDLLPYGAGLLLVAGLGLTYWRLSRAR
jgi:hypothetical protein